jgi:type II secretory pathway component GspD/PulD (secretin)
MNLKDRIEIELQRNYTPILNDALACIQVLTDDSNELQRLQNTLEGLDLPIDSEALSIALDRAKADYMALAERYDKLSDIADSYAEISDTLLYKG